MPFAVEFLNEKFILCIVPNVYSTYSYKMTIFLDSKSWIIKMVS